MSRWKVYKVYLEWKFGECLYMVGRVLDETKPLSSDVIEWNGFYSSSPDEAKKFADELNRSEDGQNK